MRRRRPSLIRELLGSLLLMVEMGLFIFPEQLPRAAQEEFQRALDLFRSERYDETLKLLAGLESRYPENFDVQQLTAIVLELSGRVEKANLHFRRSVELSPDSAMARANLGTSLLRLGKESEAVEQFREALRLQSDNVTAHYNLGTIYLRRLQFPEALPLLERTYQLQPGVYANGYQLAFCYFALGRHDKVAELLKDLQALAQDRLEHPLLQAVNLKALGRSAEAQEFLGQLLPRLTQIPEAHEQLAFLLFSQKLYGEALPILERAVEVFPGDDTARRNLAIARLRTGDLEGALVDARKALSLSPSGKAHLLVGDILEARGDHAGAVEHYQEAVRVQPDETSFYALGYQFLIHWNWREARQVFEVALRQHGNSWKLWLGLGAAWLGEGEHERATQAFLEASRIAPEELMVYHLLAQTFDLAADSFEPALERFKELHRAHPESPWATFYQAQALVRAAEKAGEAEGRKEAAELLRPIVREHADFFEAALLFGQVLFDLRQWEEAVRSLQAAVRLNPGHVQARYQLGLALQRTGRTEEARAQLRLYQELKEREDAAVTARVAQTRRLIVKLKDQ